MTIKFEVEKFTDLNDSLHVEDEDENCLGQGMLTAALEGEENLPYSMKEEEKCNGAI